MNSAQRKLVLASGSPRRATLMNQIGLVFVQEKPQVDEDIFDESPISFVTRLSRRKATAGLQARQGNEDCVIIAADTIVVLDGNILGKPQSKQNGTNMLLALSGREHQVLTGVTVRDRQDEKTFHVETMVRFRQITEKECESYWNTGEPQDKAGGYGIQGVGGIFVSSIEGSYSNVVGLPISETAVALKSFGIDCLGDPHDTPFKVVQDSQHG